MKKFLCTRILAIVALAWFAGSAATAAPVSFEASLSGPNENPTNASPGTGSAQVDFDLVAHTLRIQVAFSDLTGTTTAAHIHAAVDPPGNAGIATKVPTFDGFPLGVTSGTYDITYDTTLASSFNPSYVSANGGTTASAETALFAALSAGQSYLNIHTSTFPGGEIRGFFTAADERSAVPEPSTLALAALGLLSLSLLARRRRPA